MRHNETTRVAAVLEHVREGNQQAAIDALMLLWLEDAERPEVIDGAAIDAWQAISEAGLVDAAVAAGLALVTAGTRLRRHAFIELTERVSESDLVKIVDRVIDAGWSADPYLAAPFLRLAERMDKTTFFALTERHREAILSDDRRWELVLFVMSTSLIGDSDTLAKWFDDWTGRQPRMWMVATYAATLFNGMSFTELTNRNLVRLVEIGTQACERLVWDDSAAVFVCLKAIGDLAHGRETTMHEHRALLDRARNTSRLHHPIVRFANALKHAYPVVGAQLDEPRTALRVGTQRERLANRELSHRVADLALAVDAMLEALDLYARLEATPRGDRNVLALARTMRHLDRTSAGGWIRTAWTRLLRQRTTWRQRLRMM